MLPLVQLVHPAQCMTVYAVTSYEGICARLVQAKELRNQKSAHQLGLLLAQYAADHSLHYDLVIPVPLHWWRYCTRGYNQAAIMAQHVPAVVGGRLVQPFIRARMTAQQRLLDAARRKHNVAGAFSKKPWVSSAALTRLVAGKKVLLIDDVYTTGHTLTAFAQEVCRYAPAIIDALVACRVV